MLLLLVVVMEVVVLMEVNGSVPMRLLSYHHQHQDLHRVYC